MDMRKAARALGAVLIVALTTTGCGTGHAPSYGPVRRLPPATPGIVAAARLIRGGTGWLLAGRALSLTADDGRTWTAITPPGVPARLVKGVFFLDRRHGWVAWAKPVPGGRALLEISSTADRGRSWSASPLGRPSGLFADTLTEPAYIDFTDPQHGWVTADITLTPLSPLGVLFRTTDGGASWRQLPIPVSGPVAFTGPRTGWLVCDCQPGTRRAERFYVTSDGGRAWHAQTVIPPAGYRRDRATYLIPQPAGPAGAVLAATFGGGGSPRGDGLLPARRSRRVLAADGSRPDRPPGRAGQHPAGDRRAAHLADGVDGHPPGRNRDPPRRAPVHGPDVRPARRRTRQRLVHQHPVRLGGDRHRQMSALQGRLHPDHLAVRDHRQRSALGAEDLPHGSGIGQARTPGR